MSFVPRTWTKCDSKGLPRLKKLPAMGIEIEKVLSEQSVSDPVGSMPLAEEIGTKVPDESLIKISLISSVQNPLIVNESEVSRNSVLDESAEMMT